MLWQTIFQYTNMFRSGAAAAPDNLYTIVVDPAFNF